MKKIIDNPSNKNKTCLNASSFEELHKSEKTAYAKNTNKNAIYDLTLIREIYNFPRLSSMVNIKTNQTKKSNIRKGNI
jgi:hypothetical protein